MQMQQQMHHLQCLAAAGNAAFLLQRYALAAKSTVFRDFVLGIVLVQQIMCQHARLCEKCLSQMLSGKNFKCE